jgi:hypothetical protein
LKMRCSRILRSIQSDGGTIWPPWKPTMSNISCASV